MQFPHTYKNGNGTITIDSDGTRTIECDGELVLDFPLNIDVRLSRKCAFGLNEKTGKAICDFCHESATTDGKDASFADINRFFVSTVGLPRGTEIALGLNQITEEAEYFITSCWHAGFIVNVTVNQGHLRRDKDLLHDLIDYGWISGLGISYRSGMIDIDPEFLEYKNTVVHVIAGLDSIVEVKQLASKGVKKILVLGEKDFGFNLGKVKIVSASHVKWFREVHELFKLFDVVSFDNLALEQLKIKRFVKDWDTMYQHEFSFYANLVDGTFSPSSRSSDVVPMMNIQEYFKTLVKSVL